MAKFTNDKKYFDLSDETLVSLTLLGNNEALESLIIRYQKIVASSAYSITKNYHLAEDIMQDSFLTAWKKLNTLREPGKFGAWICNIAKNKAKNAAVKYQDYVHLDSLENVKIESGNPEEDYDALHMAIENLSDKLKNVIKLHYFANASIDEISKKLNLPVGTVKRQLHDGREKIRKELGYMETNSKEIAKSVLEKIKELRIRWRARTKKDGFETEYDSMMAEIEQMPDTEEKYYHMADVMQLGWWWIPGNDSAEMTEKIRDVAQKGKNAEILGEIWKREAEKYSGEEKTAYILNTLIPRMEQANMTDALGWEWFWLGHEYFKNGDHDAGYAAYNKVLEILPKHHVYHANAIAAIRMEKLTQNVNENNMCAGATGEELFIDKGKLYFDKQPGYTKGGGSHSFYFPGIFYHASRCDNTLYDSSLKPGESIKSHDGNTELKFVSDNAEIETSCGKFDGCELWATEAPGFDSAVYYKRGIGIVYISIVQTGGQYGKGYCSLKKYNIAGGDGLIPFCEGNSWEYDSGSVSDAKIVYEIISFKEPEVIFAAHEFGIKTYSPDVWDDMILQMRREYHDGKSALKDVSFQMERAAALADTKYKKVHTAVATDVMKRIYEGDSDFTPDGKIEGYWNFLQYHDVKFEGGKITLEEDRNYAFEWKNTVGGDMSYHLAVNYFMSIIADATGCIWNDAWKPGAKMTVRGKGYFNPITDISVSHLDSLEVVAGRFEDCLKVTFDIKGDDGAGWNNFLKGKKEYYYARGIGLIKGVHYFKDDTVVPNYELTYYEGTGEGYMPAKDGLFRRYEAMGLTKGFVGKAEYTFCEDDSGELKLLENNTGIRDKTGIKI